MARGTTIRAFVLGRLSLGKSAEEAWREAEARFPHRAISWNYIGLLAREYRRTTDAVAQVAKFMEGLIADELDDLERGRL